MAAVVGHHEAAANLSAVSAAADIGFGILENVARVQSLGEEYTSLVQVMMPDQYERHRRRGGGGRSGWDGWMDDWMNV